MGDAEVQNFHEMGIDPRILKSIAFLGWKEPTPVQESAIPLALSGKDLLVDATTGSGKTAIFLIPIINKLLMKRAEKSENPDKKPVSAVILTPTKELAFQAEKMFEDLSRYCKKTVSAYVVDPMANAETKHREVQEMNCDILIGTPSQLLKTVLRGGKPKLLKKVSFLVIDEADVMFSFGYYDDIKKLVSFANSDLQSIVVSATLSKEVAMIKTLLPKNPVVVRLKNQSLPEKTQLKQFYITCEDQVTKFIVLLALFKFNILRGKCLIYCISRKLSYKIKLFLDSFKISSCVLNKLLPFNSRNHVVSEFNNDVYKILIATDDATNKLQSSSMSQSSSTNTSKKVSIAKQGKPTKHERQEDSEYSLSRGIDFQGVSVVLNFDLPDDPVVYIHRAGRTARGASKGTVLSFVTKGQEDTQLQRFQDHLRGPDDGNEDVITPFNMDMGEVEKLRYRVNDVLSSISKQAVNKAQKEELNNELVQSKELKSHFRSNPNDLTSIQHDQNRAVTVLKNKFDSIGDIPKYLIPKSLQDQPTTSSEYAQAGSNSNLKRKAPKKETLEYYTKLGLVTKGKKRKKDPLKSF